MSESGDGKLMLLVKAWMQRREIDGFEPEFRALVTDVVSREQFSAPTPDDVHRVLDERFATLLDGTLPDAPENAT